MTDKKEQIPAPLVHMLLAFRRRKDNPDGDIRCLREVLYHEEEVAVARLKAKCSAIPGVWRLHMTVNARDTEAAAKVLTHKLVDNPKDVGARLESIWRSCLLQSSSRAGRRILLDVDDPSILSELHEAIKDYPIVSETSTPSGGKHIIMEEGFDTRALYPFTKEQVTPHRDGYYFLDVWRF